MKSLLPLSSILAIMCFLSGPVQARQASGGEDEYLPGSFYVKFAPGTVHYAKSADRILPIGSLFPQKGNLDAYGLHKTAYGMYMDNAPFLDNVFRIDFDSLDKAQDFFTSLQEDPRIELVERIPLQRISLSSPSSEPASASKEESLPNDPYFGVVDGINTSWHLEMVGFSELYGKHPVDTDLVVAVVDNAVWGQHEDLQLDSMLMYDACSGQVGSSNPPKWINQNQEGTPQSLSSAYNWSHGTHCAGLVGARTDNGKGIASLAGGVKVMGVRVAENAALELSHAVQGVIWAADHGADIISMSFGGTSHSSIEGATYAALAQKGIILIAAAGNTGKDEPNYPAAYPGVISVGSVNSDGYRSYFSNFGDWVDVWAPGGFLVENGGSNENVQIFSTTYCVSQFYSGKETLGGKYYDAMSGTSMATPLVSSSAALLLSSYPELNGYQMKEVLAASSPVVNTTYIHIPTAFEYLETAGQKQVRDLEARWKPSTKICQLRWQQPEEEGVTVYAVYQNGTRVGTTRQTDFSFEMNDTAGYVGVRAVYRLDSALTRYVKVQVGEFPSTGNGSDLSYEPEPLQVRVDARSGMLTVSTQEKIEGVEIYNIQGACLRKFAGNGPSYSVGNLPQGLYIGRAKVNGTFRNFKFVL